MAKTSNKNINKDKTLYNSLLNLSHGNELLDLIKDNITDNSDSTFYIGIINVIYETSPSSAINIAIDMLESDNCYEAVLCKLIELTRKHPYLIKENIENFEKCIECIHQNHHKFSYETLVSFIDCIEFVFAHGVKELSKSITGLYRLLPIRTLSNEEQHIRKELACVYEYNGLNYNTIYNKLCAIYKQCKRSKRKYMYGMVNYYFAVLCIMSGSYDIHKDKGRLELACDYGYNMAHILKNHYTNVF